MSINDYCKTSNVYNSTSITIQSDITEVIRKIAQDWNVTVKDKDYNDIASENLATAEDLQYLIFKSTAEKDYYIRLKVNTSVSSNYHTRPILTIGVHSKNSGDEQEYSAINTYSTSLGSSSSYWKILYAENLSKNTRVLTISVSSDTNFPNDKASTRNQSVIISKDNLDKINLITVVDISSQSEGLKIINEEVGTLSGSRTRGTIAYNIPAVSSAFSVNYFVPFINPFSNNKIENIELGVYLNNTTWGVTTKNYSYVIDNNSIVHLITPLIGVGASTNSGYNTFSSASNLTDDSMPSYILAINLGITAN